MDKGKLTREFHLRTAEAGNLNIPGDSTLWPEEWKKIYFKEYKRFPKIILPCREKLPVDLSQILGNRSSCRYFDDLQTISLEIFGTLLKTSVGLQKDKRNERRAYPSGGARYPIEIYLSIKENAVENLNGGLYHYQFKDHSLEQMELFESENTNIRSSTMTYEWAREAPIIIIFTAVWRRIMDKYQDFGYHLTLIEAGHMAENLIILGEALGLGTCPIAGIKKVEAAKILDLDPLEEAPVYCLAIGKIKSVGNPIG